MKCRRGCNTQGKHLDKCKDKDCWGCVIMETSSPVCERCGEQFDRSMTQIRLIWGQLNSMLVAGQTHNMKERITGTPARGFDMNEQVSKVKDSVHDWAVFVHRIIVSESKLNQDPEDRTTLAILGVIHSKKDWLLTHELAAEFVSDAKYQAKKVSDTISPATRHRIPIKASTCQAEDERGICNGRLYAVLRDKSSRVKSAVYCVTNASHRMEMADLVAASKETRQWLKSDEVALSLGVTKENVSVIAHRESWITKKDWKEVSYSLESVENHQARKANR